MSRTDSTPEGRGDGVGVAAVGGARVDAADLPQAGAVEVGASAARADEFGTGEVGPDEVEKDSAAGERAGVTDLDTPHRGRTGLVVSLVVAVLALAFVWVLATRDPGSERRANSDLVGRVAPAVAGRTLDGGTFDIDDHRGRWVVVNFFATWCVPCRQEHPELNAFDEAHRRLGDARVVSVLYDDDPAEARDFFARYGGDWPVVLDDGAIANDYGVTGVPETYLVAPNGRVVTKLLGGVRQDDLDRIIGEVEQAQAQAQQGGGR